MDIEAILEMYEDDYNPSSTVPGPRNMYGDGGITEGKKANKGTFYLRIPNEDGVRINHSGTKFQMEQLLKKYKKRLKIKKIPSNKLTADQSKIILEWGKNKSKALGETWSNKKTLKEYDNSSEDMRQKIRSGDVTGKGGSWSEGQIKPLTTEQQKLWNATMADEFGKWEDYPETDRNRWRNDFPRKQKIYSQTKDLLNIDELAEYLGKKFDTDISRNKIRGSFGAGNRTALGTYIKDNLFVDSFGSIKGNIKGEVRGNVSYYKKPTDTQINQIKKQNLVFDTRTNTLKPKTLKNINTLNEMYGDVYRSGKIPKLQDMMNATNLSEGEIARAEAKLAQIYNGHKFRNGPDDIRVNKNAANKLFNFMSKAQFGDPRKTELYNISLDLIDEGLGNEKNTFSNLKNKARKILKENGIKVHSTKSPIGFNIDELAGVTGSAKSKNMAVSQFINVIEGNLNTKTLQNFQSSLSKARSAVETAKGTPRYNSVLKKQMELINNRAAKLEKDFGIKLARLEKPADINNMSANEVKRLKNIKLGTGENLYQRLVKDAKASGYSVKMPPGTLTIQEFVDPKNETQIKQDLLKLAGTKNKKCKGLLSYGGRVGLAEGLSPEFCLNEGKKVAQEVLFEGGGTPAQKSVARRLISAGGKMALSMLNPKELIRLSNLVGPGALGLMGLYEAGSITDDVLRLNKPLDEALAGNWLTKSFLPYSEEFAKQKNLLQSGQLTGDQKEYALEMMKMENFIKEGQRIEGLESNKLVEGTLDDNFTFTSKEDMNKAYKDLIGKFSRIKPYAYEQGITGRGLENEAAMNEYIDAQTARTGASKIFGGPQPMVNKAPRPKNMTRGPMTEKGKMNLDYDILGYTPYDKAYTPTDEEILQIYRNRGIVPATFGGELQPGEGTRVRMGLASQGDNRSIYGSNFSEGGITTLRSKYDYKK